MSHWSELENGKHGDVVRDLRKVIRRGLRKIDADKLGVLPRLFGNGVDADTHTVRERLLEFLLRHDPGAHKDDSPKNLSTATNIRLTIFRACEAYAYTTIAHAREKAGDYYRERGMSAESVRKGPGPEFYAVKELSEEIAGTSSKRMPSSAGRQRPPAATAPKSAPKATVGGRYQATPASELKKGFWWRTATPKYIDALAELNPLTIYAGADGSADVGPPLHRELYEDVLISALANDGLKDVVAELDRPTSRAVVEALGKTCPPMFIASIIRQLHQGRSGASRRAEGSLHSSIQYQITRSRKTTGFVDHAIAQLAITMRGAERNVSIITAHLDSDLIDLPAGVAGAVGLPEIKLVDLVDADAPMQPAPDVVPLMRIHGSLADTCAQPLVVGEADFFSDIPLSGEHGKEHIPRLRLIANALERGAVVFVGTSITEPGLISALASTRHLRNPRYAILVAPDLSGHGITPQDKPTEYATALALFASRYLHLNVTPVIVDFDQQVPQLLREVAERVRVGQHAYTPYPQRVQSWWDAVVPFIGLDAEGNRVSAGNRDFRERWARHLRAIRESFDSDGYQRDLDAADGERITVEVWLRNHHSRQLVRVATSARTDSSAAYPKIDIVSTESNAIVAEAFRRGRPVARRLSTGRDKYAIAVYLLLRGPSLRHLPVGVVLVKSTRADAVVAACGDAADELLHLEEVINRRLSRVLDVPDALAEATA